MKNIRLLPAAAFFALSATAFSQSADDILNKHFEAMGGKDKLSGVKCVKMTGKANGQGMEFPFTIYIINGKAMRFDMTVQSMTMTQCVTGDSGWFISPWMGKKDAEKMPADMVKDSKERVDIGGPIMNYKEKGNKVELVGKEDMEGTDVYKLRLTQKSGDVTYYFIDASNYYVLKETSKHKFQDKEVEGEQLYSNFKKVDGVLFPFSSESRQVGESAGQTITFDAIEVNPKIDASMFAMPKPTGESGK